MNIKVLKFLIIGLIVVGCGGKVDEVPTDKFIGLWELKGRSMFDGIQIRIESKNEKLTVRALRLPAVVFHAGMAFAR